MDNTCTIVYDIEILGCMFSICIIIISSCHLLGTVSAQVCIRYFNLKLQLHRNITTVACENDLLKKSYINWNDVHMGDSRRICNALSLPPFDVP
jgi:hypothetical protein